ncbi:hypothetical protein [Atrimonas thermophila]|jgi:hypothetical protein|uniref:hypothetical protein n=1 Tax=Atrimonas thermophila TaxID=3064161 RepID=UPI00399CC3F7
MGKKIRLAEEKPDLEATASGVAVLVKQQKEGTGIVLRMFFGEKRRAGVARLNEKCLKFI